MAKLRLAGAMVAIGVVALCLFAGNSRAQASHVAYDAFCGLSVDTKKKLFTEVSADNRADLVRTQIQRWLDKNRSRLSAEQIKIMEENIAFVKADLYKIPRRDGDLDKAKDLERRTLALMPREDMTEAFTIYGSCIAKG